MRTIMWTALVAAATGGAYWAGTCKDRSTTEVVIRSGATPTAEPMEVKYLLRSAGSRPIGAEGIKVPTGPVTPPAAFPIDTHDINFKFLQAHFGGPDSQPSTANGLTLLERISATGPKIETGPMPRVVADRAP